jgi:hypothetical protein
VCDVVCESKRVSHQKKEDSGRTLGMVTGRGSVCGCMFSVVTEGRVRSPWSMCGWFGVRVGECVVVVMQVSAIATRSCIWFGLSSC